MQVGLPRSVFASAQPLTGADLIDYGAILRLPKPLVRRVPELPSSVHARYSISATSFGCSQTTFFRPPAYLIAGVFREILSIWPRSLHASLYLKPVPTEPT